jgi:hypothetical protein
MKPYRISLAHDLGDLLATLPLNLQSRSTQVFEFDKWYIQKTYFGNDFYEILARYRTDQGYVRFFAYEKPYNYGSHNVVFHDNWVIEVEHV